ncbi:hypothetical protein N1851_023264 [Merluccius polli]|uniref:Uncharacterized protein n=1 Tax=Merluccius polli TaxID=89951 RepID=A0AA47NXR0_MERPO|nr:hypothetical protein N1851_023264 [Merluccius polli]
MSPLTSPSDCVHQIREAEMLLDTIIFGPTGSISTSVSAASPSSPVAAPKAAEATPPPRPMAAATAPPPDTVSNDSWIRQGAKPKTLTSSTPSDPEPWSRVSGCGRRRGKRSSCTPHHNIQLENTFSSSPSLSQRPLGSLPPPSSPAPIPVHSAARTRRSIPLFTPAPSRAAAHQSVHHPPATPLSLENGGDAAVLALDPVRPALPTIMLANVRSLDRKMDFINLWRATQRALRDCCAFIFTKTWMKDNLPDSAVELTGLTLHRADRVAATSGKLRGGGMAVYINDS